MPDKSSRSQDLDRAIWYHRVPGGNLALHNEGRETEDHGRNRTRLLAKLRSWAAWMAVGGLLAGCGGTPATLEPTSTSRPSNPPASATPMPPTRTATPLPPIPTANFTPDQIVGIWHRSDIARGELFLTLSADGTYDAAHGTPEGSVHHGHYSLEGALFTFLDGWNCSPEPHTPGKYILRLIGGGRFLYLEVYEDACPDRPSAMSGFRNDRWVVATPTP